MSDTHKRITVAISGASGTPYALRLIECLLQAGVHIYLVISSAAQVVSSLEMEMRLPQKIESFEKYLATLAEGQGGSIELFGQQQWSAPIASGTAVADAMVVCPCSSGCLSAIATGASNNLLERAADVTLKERKPLVLVPRETPLSTLHLENMLKLSRMGVTILPASPGFYYKPESVQDMVDFIVARILDQISIPQKLIPPWGKQS